MAPKKEDPKKDKRAKTLVKEPEPPPRDPLKPLTFDELWFDDPDLKELTAWYSRPKTQGADAGQNNEADQAKKMAQEGAEKARKISEDLKKHIMIRAVDIRLYLEENIVALLLQGLQHLILDRPRDPFKYLANYFLDNKDKIKIELELAQKCLAEKKAKLEAEEKAKLAAEEKAKFEAEEKVKLEAEQKAKLDSDAAAAAKAPKEKIKVEEKPSGPKKPGWKK